MAGQTRQRSLAEIGADFEAAAAELASAAAAAEKHWRSGAKLRKTRDEAQAKVMELHREILSVVTPTVLR